MFDEFEVSDDEEEIALLTNKFKRFLKSKESQRERRIKESSSKPRERGVLGEKKLQFLDPRSNAMDAKDLGIFKMSVPP